MRIAVISKVYPMYDRSAGDLRFSQLLRFLAPKHEVQFCPQNSVWLARHIGESEATRYRKAIESMGVLVSEKRPDEILRAGQFDVILFEFYNTALQYLTLARRLQPRARIVVDSVDVHFHRLLAKARLTRDNQDLAEADKVKREELSVYAQADVVVAVSEADKNILLAELRGTDIAVVPCIHTIPTRRSPMDIIPNSLLFIGSFNHEPNVDAMVYFCRDVMPLIRKHVPDVRLRIIGDWGPDSVKKLANDHVDVMGFVPDTTPYLRSTHVSIAPLRYGAGMKGKISEAMSHALPVVTTSTGIDGFGLTPGENVLVGDTPQSFADAVINVLTDRQLSEKLSEAGWRFIKRNYSTEAVEARIDSLFEGLASHKVKQLPLATRLKGLIPESIRQQLYWRFMR